MFNKRLLIANVTDRQFRFTNRRVKTKKVVEQITECLNLKKCIIALLDQTYDTTSISVLL